MTQSGGSATMYGILYQLLGTAHWAGRFHLNAPTDNNEWDEAKLIIEPSGGGGDIQIHTSQCHVIEQWKAKSDCGSWSLKQIIAEVLPDLYRSVDLTNIEQKTEFCFVTEGHQGRWSSATKFFTELSGAPIPDDPFLSLDNNESISFFPSQEHTRQTFFRYIHEELRTHRDIAKDEEIESAKKIWYLLGRLVFNWDRTFEKVTSELDDVLRPFVDYKEHVESKRHELCGVLLELGSSGNAIFTPNELLEKAGLDHISFCNWGRARDSLWNTTQRTIQDRWQYCGEDDVRSPIHPPEDSFVCVLTGESGQGKTWSLASLAHEL